jgi:hypothetical protein
VLVSDIDEPVLRAKEAYVLALKAGAPDSAAMAAACVVYRRWRSDASEEAIREAVNIAMLNHS